MEHTQSLTRVEQLISATSKDPHTLQVDALCGSSGLVMLSSDCASGSTKVYFLKIQILGPIFTLLSWILQ